METTHKLTRAGDSSASIFLTGAILVANIDYTSLLDYTLRAIIGGAIWMGFKLVSDFMAVQKNKPKGDLKNEN